MTAELAVVQETLQSVKLGQYFEVTPTGLVVHGDPNFNQCEALWETLLTFEKVVQLAIGDAMRFFRERFGERADQIISHRTGWSRSTLRNYEWTAEKVPPSVRRLDVLSFSHHQKVAALPPGDQERLLNAAAAGDGDGEPWSVNRLASEIKVSAGQAARVDFIVTVYCESEADQAACCRQLENLGRRYRAATGARKEAT